MVDSARQLLDELMGRNRNLDPAAKVKKLNWEDPEFCQFFLVKFCPHDLFVNTRADLGQCAKMHDEEAKRLFEEARPSNRKRVYEDEFLRFCNNMINEVDRKIQKGKQRLLLMNKGEGGAGPVYVSKFQEQLNNLNARIKKLIGEAEEAGNRGDVDQAQGLMKLCDQLKEEKEILLKQHDNGTGNWAALTNDLSTTQEKQMEVCQVCGAFLIVGDAQQRIEDHLTGKQHLGYSRLRKAVDEMYEQRKKERDDDTRRGGIVDEERRPPKPDFGVRDKDRRNRDDFDEKRPRRDDRDRRDRDRREIRSSEKSDRTRDGKDRDRRNPYDSSHRDRSRDSQSSRRSHSKH